MCLLQHLTTGQVIELTHATYYGEPVKVCGRLTKLENGTWPVLHVANNLRGHPTEKGHRSVLLSLGLTKGGKRTGAAESVVLAHDAVVRPLQPWMSLASLSTPLTPTPGVWRSWFNQGMESLGITSYGFRPYSLRRGGATWWFGKHHSLDRILLQGRWQGAKTARIYLNEGLSVLAQLQIGPKDKRLVSYLSVYTSHLKNPTFATLEPPAKSWKDWGTW